MKTNSIYEALNNVDDKFVSEAAKTRGKRPVALMITTASLAAALALAVGIRNFGGAIGNYISPADSAKQNGASYQAADFVELPKYTIPEEFMPDTNDDEKWFEHLDMLPTEIFDKFGVSPLINDNFTDVIDDFTQQILENGESLADHYKPCVWVTSSGVVFDYVLHDNNTDQNIFFSAHFYKDIEDYRRNSFENSQDEGIILNDGSKCILSPNTAHFMHKGTLYFVHVEEPDTNTEKDIENIKQVLTDLGVL